MTEKNLQQIAEQFDEDAPVSEGYLDTESRNEKGEQFGYE